MGRYGDLGTLAIFLGRELRDGEELRRLGWAKLSLGRAVASSGREGALPQAEVEGRTHPEVSGSGP